MVHLSDLGAAHPLQGLLQLLLRKPRGSRGDTKVQGLHCITIRRVEYDVEREAQELLRSGLTHADCLARILLSGQYCPPD